MSTLASPTPIPLQSDVRAELEPDKTWKDALRAKIEDGLSSMVEDAKKNYQSQLTQEMLSDARREAITREFNEAMNNIRNLAQDTFVVELERERQERRWAAGVDMIPSWNEALVQEQRDIMNIIQGTRKSTRSPGVAEQSSSVRAINDQPVVELSSSPSGPPFSLLAQSSAMAQERAEQRRERSLSTLEHSQHAHMSSTSTQAPQPPPDSPATTEKQRQQEEKVRRILERKVRERERQEKADQEKERLRKEKEEEMKEKLKEQDRIRMLEKQLLERGRAEKERQDRERAEKERQDKERSEKQRREWERAEKERMEKQWQIEKELLGKQRLENEMKKERMEKESREKEERERMEGEIKDREDRAEEEREKRRLEKERQEREEREDVRLDRERWENEHLEKLEAMREEEEREEKERSQREEEGMQEREKAREISRQRDWQHKHVQEVQAHNRLQTPLNGSSPESTDVDLSDACDTDDLELLSPPLAHSISVRKHFIHEWPGDIPVGKSTNNFSRLLSSDRPSARSPPMVLKPSSIDDDAKPLLGELGRRNSVTSIKSTGSVGVRPSIVDETILERSDSEAECMDENVRVMESEEWSTSKPWERERRREHWKSSSSDSPRGDESHTPHFSNLRASHQAEDTKPLPRDRYDIEQSYRGLRSHRSEEIPNRPTSNVRTLRREASFHEEYDDVYQPYPPSRPIRPRTSFEDRGGSYTSFQPSSQGRVPTRPSSTLNDERDYYDQASYRPYPTPPSSANRSSIRDHIAPPSRYPSGLSYGYNSELRSNTFKYAQQPESSLSRRPSESRPNLKRGPSFTQNYSEEPSPLHASPSESYPRTYERVASASIPILARQHRPSHGSEETDGWRSWSTESPPIRRESRRETERRDRYDQDRNDFQDCEYSSRSGREYEVWHPDSYPYYGPHPEPPRRKGYPMRSPMASHPGSYHDGPDYSFGGRDRTYEPSYDNDEFIDDMETDMAPSSRYRDVPRQRREEVQRLSEEERNRWEAEEWRRRMAEEEVERWRQTDERTRFAFEEEEAQRRETKQEAKRKEIKRQTAEVRLDGETWQREDALRRQAEEARKAKAEAMRIAREVRIQAEEAKRKEEEATRKEEEVSRRDQEARRKEEEVRRQAEEAKRKEEEARLKEEEARKKEEEAKRKEEDVRRQAEEARRKEVAAREEARRVREENWKREQDMKYREEELKKREEDLQRREREIEAEKLQKAQEESRKEAERLQKQLNEEEEQRRVENQKKREERFRHEQQQEEFRRREQEIHERKRQDSMGGVFPSSYTSSPIYSARSYPSPSASINGQTPGWSSSPKPNATSKASSTSAGSQSRSGSMNASFPTSTPSPHPSPSFDEAEFKRKQEEFSQQQQEKFRKEQLRFEETRQRTESNKLSPEQVLSTLERHERQWNILTSSATSLHWGSIPWPMFFPPQTPEDITLSVVTMYLQSPLLPDREKAKPQKDRLKEMIKKWHPDRFETKYLPRIIEGDREKVKEGTGVVIRLLNELLTKINTPGPFGPS